MLPRTNRWWTESVFVSVPTSILETWRELEIMKIAYNFENVIKKLLPPTCII